MIWLRVLWFTLSPTMSNYAAYWVAALRAQGGTPIYDPDRQVVTVGEGRTVGLANMFADVLTQPFWRRPRRLHAQLVGSQISVADLTLDEALPRLFPRVLDRSFFEVQRLRKMGDPIAFLPLTENLAMALVIDSEHSVAYVNEGMLARWGRTMEHLRGVARSNLIAVTQDRAFQGVEVGVFRSTHQDDYDDARVLLAPMLEKLPLKGARLICVANRNALFVTGEEEPNALENLLRVSGAALKSEPRPTHGRVLRLTGFELTEVVDPTCPALCERLLAAHAHDVAEQGQALESIFEAAGEDIFVANLITFRRPGEEAMRTAVSWSEGVHALLPEADLIGFGSAPPGAEKPTAIVFVEWAVAKEVVGDLLEATPHYPARWRTRGFPNADQLAVLQARRFGG